jgi:hypothetical protein
MENDYVEDKVIEFPEEGVRFNLNGNFKKIWVEKLPAGQLPGPSPDFDPNRFVINFRLYHEDDPTQDVIEFSGTIHLTVNFLQKDLDSAKDLEYLDLGFYHGSKWVSFKKKKNLEKKMDNAMKPWIGYGKSIIKDKLPDPMMAWGP